jgi:hypothetical protein
MVTTRACLRIGISAWAALSASVALSEPAARLPGSQVKKASRSYILPQQRSSSPRAGAESQGPGPIQWDTPNGSGNLGGPGTGGGGGGGA